MTRLVPLIVLLLLLPVASVLAGDLPQVLQPNTTAYSVSEVAALTQAIATLTEALNNYNMASRRYFSTSEWSSRDFAMYTAGVLSEKRYETVLVSGDGWPDGSHTWVLVGIPLGGRTAWIPVEAAPEADHSQQILGHIPGTSDTAGKMWFDKKYLTFANAVQLPPNIPPIARIRKPIAAVIEGEASQLMAITSVDPDGDIVLYKWDFGDGDTQTSTTWSVRHEFSEAGRYTVRLVVVDNRGRNASTTLATTVLKLDENGTPSSNGCGCGG